MVAKYEQGETLCGRYVVERQLGRPGGSGTAFLAFDPVLGERVVCKVAHLPLGQSGAEFAEQFRKLVRLRSTNVVASLGLEVHSDDGEEYPVLVLDFVDGPTFGKWASGAEPLAVTSALAAVAASLALMHDVGMTHGDLFDGNVVVDSAGRAVLIDPLPDYGSPSSLPEGEEYSDLDTLVKLLQEFAPGMARPGLEPLLSKHRTDTPSAREYATVLWGAARRPWQDGTDEVHLAVAQTFRHELKEAHKLYPALRRLRAAAIDELFEWVRRVAEPFEATLEANWGANEDEEERTDETAMGSFYGRSLRVTSPAGAMDLWDIVIQPCHEFRKPWPSPHDRAVASGTSYVRSFGNVSHEVELAIVLEEDFSTRFIITIPDPPYPMKPVANPRREMTEEWLKECVYALVGKGPQSPDPNKG